MRTIQEINDRIISEGNRMASEVKDAITKITLNVSPQCRASISKDVPSRPWMLTGYTCIAIGVIATISNNTAWSYIIGAFGIVSLLIGFYKKKQQKFVCYKKEVSDFNIDNEKAFIIDKCNKILDYKKSEWDAFMESTKTDVQNIIKATTISDEKKDEFLSLTYYPETFSLSTLSLIDKFDTIGNDFDVVNQILIKNGDFANEVALTIIQTANKQVQIYNRIRF